MKNTILHKRPNKEQLEVNIRFNDQCKNGHDTFSITGTLYKGAGRSDASMIKAGCIHDEILASRPDLKPFTDLHLSDGDGVPMHGTSNGFYFFEMMQGFAEYHEVEEGDKDKYFTVLCEHLRISKTEGERLVSKLLSIPNNDYIKAVTARQLIKKMQVEIWDVKEAIRLVSKRDKPVEQLETLKKNYEELQVKAKKEANIDGVKMHFNRFVDSLRPRWAKEAQEAKSLLTELSK